MTDIERRVSAAADDAELQRMMGPFCASADRRLRSLDALASDVSDAAAALARRFSEDAAKTRLAETLSVFADLIDRIGVADRENEARRRSEERAAGRAKRKAPVARDAERRADDEACIVDKLLVQVRRGNFDLHRSRRTLYQRAVDLMNSNGDTIDLDSKAK